MQTESLSLIDRGEKLLSFATAAKHVPGHRGQDQIHPSTLFRWATKGVLAATGERIRLESCRIGGGWRTSIQALARFSAALTDASLPADTPTPPATPKQRQRAAAQASREAAAIFGGTD